MKIPSPIYGALGGAAVASLAWLLFSPSGNQDSGTAQQAGTQALHNPISAIGKTQSLTSIDNAETANGHSAEGILAGNFPSANQPGSRSASKQDRTEAMPPRDELIARAVIVEDHANSRLQILTSRLGLSEKQQDRIFPILASSSPAFHPILQPEGRINYLKDSVFGEGIEPGASVTEVENEIYPVLDEDQKASLEEKAIDREAWWEDIVALLAEDLDQPAVTSADVNPSNERPTDPTQETDNQSQREAAATVNGIDDISSLLRGK